MQSSDLHIKTDLKLVIEQTIKQILDNGSLSPEYMDTVQAAKYLGLSKQRLEIWRVHGGGPTYIKLAQAVRYKKTDLDDFMAAHSCKNTSEGGCHE